MFRKGSKEKNQKQNKTKTHVGSAFQIRKHIILGGAHFWTKNDERLFRHESKEYICIRATCTGNACFCIFKAIHVGLILFL